MKSTNKLRVIHIRVPLTPAYTNDYLQLRETVIDLNLALTDGDHYIVTDPMDVGYCTMSGPLKARLSFWYRYSSKSNMVTFCANELLSEDTMCLITTPKNTNQPCYQYTHSGTLVEKHNTSWNIHTPLTPGLQDALRESVGKANNRLIAKAKTLDLNVSVRKPLPDLSAEHYARLSSVYHAGRFLEYYDPRKTYGPEHTIRTIDSTGYSTVDLMLDADFANVRGSTHDPTINGNSWIGLWRLAFKMIPDCCTSKGFPKDVVCKDDLVGGHTVIGQEPETVPKAAGRNDVMIIPICKPHNNKYDNYMKALKTQKAVLLSNYCNKNC